MHHPRLSIFRDQGLLGSVIRVLERRSRTYGQSLAYPFPNTLAGHAHPTCNLRDGLAGMVTQHDPSPLCLPPWRRPRIPQLLELLDLFSAQPQSRSLRLACHTFSVAANKPIRLCFIETIY